MRYGFRVAIALAMVFSGAAAYADNGTILFTRPVMGTYNGEPAEVGSGLFLMHDNGTGFRQLTPLVANSYYFPSGVAYPGTAQQPYPSGTWLTRNFSPDGQFIQYFEGQSSSPYSGPFPGKYYVRNLSNGSTYALFPGTNDNNPPGYGYLAWGPAGSNEIAYANSTSALPVSPPCVELMHTDGTDPHTLWCAPPTIPHEGGGPTLAVDFIRWSGNGKSLLAFVSYEPPPLTVPRQMADRPIGGTGWAALFVINVQTGAATLVAPDAIDSPAIGDISYDGNVVLYQQPDFNSCGDTNTEALGVNLCVTNLTTGAVTTLLPSNYWQTNGVGAATLGYYPTALLSPDGSEAAVTMSPPNSEVYEEDLYIVKTDGSGTLRQLTSRPPNTPASQAIEWIAAAWAPDGCQLLVNNVSATETKSGYSIEPSQIHIFALSDGRDWHVTQGYAVDWLKQ